MQALQVRSMLLQTIERASCKLRQISHTYCKARVLSIGKACQSIQHHCKRPQSGKLHLVPQCLPLTCEPLQNLAAGFLHAAEAAEPDRDPVCSGIWQQQERQGIPEEGHRSNSQEEQSRLPGEPSTLADTLCQLLM